MSHPRRFCPRVRAATVALALAAAGLGLTGTGSAHAADPVAQVWVTTPDGAKKLAAEGGIPFTATPQPVDIRIDANSKGQRFTGAGASVTEASAHLVQGLPADRRGELMRSLFSTGSDGIGLNYLRQPLGSTDFNAGGFYTYEDTPGQFAITRDRAEIIPVLQQATSVNPAIRFMGSPWSPPAWMKTGNSLNGGSLRPEHYQTYADYLVKAIKAYGQQGITLTDLTAQNEPEFATSYPSTSMTSAEQAEFFKVLDRALTAAGLPTNLLAYDHNWDHPNFPLDVLSRTSGIPRVIGAAFHCYGGTPAAQQQVTATGKRVFFTECSGTDSADRSTTFADTLKWHAENLVVQNMRTGGETVVNWNLALDQNGGPHQGHCTDRCNGIVEIANGTVTKGAEYYVLGHVTRFVKPGAIRIGSTSQGGGGVRNVAFQNPDGTRAAYVVNTASSAQRVSLTDSGRSAAYTLPAGAVATFTWSGSGSGTGDTQAPTAPGGLTATAAGAAAVDLRWGASFDDTAVTGYRVYRGTTLVATTAATAHTDTGLTGSTSYTYTVRAIDAAGNVSPASATATATTAPGGSGSTIDPTVWYQVRNSAGAKCLDAADWGTGDGTALQQWACGGGANQAWRFTPTTGGAYQVVNRHNGKVWDVDGGPGATADGTAVHLWTSGGGTNQQWTATDRGNGAYSFTARHSGKCLTVENASTADGARLAQRPCTGAPAQTFTLDR
ncbi:RICIN domain-containing protein [Streptomyces sp. NPDC005899]|uniref:RICIN domain-containing protein n=1 Tax=Streptomyces sp. NPDC005899 TaxID=3155716 RepID=UPI0033DAB256